MTVQEAARTLEVSPSLIYKLCAAGRLGHRRIGLGRGAIRVDHEHIAAYLRRCEVEADGAIDERGERTVKTPGGVKVRVPDFFGEMRAERAKNRTQRKR
jgi:excisionase family DNA binding protein